MSVEATRNPAQLLLKLNSLISRLSRSNQNAEALQVFADVFSSADLTPDHYSLSSAITACTNLRCRAAGAQLHAHAIRSGLSSYPHVANSLLSFYAKSNSLESTSRLFDDIRNPDAYSCTTLLSAYGKVGRLQDALQLFNQMPQKNTAVWNSMITGCAEHRHRELALELFSKMHQVGIGYDQYTLASALSLFNLPETISLGRQVHLMAIKTGFAMFAVSVTNALITMYFNCGVIEDAYAVFEGSSMCNHITYNAVIAGLISWGRDGDSMMMFKEMLREACFWPSELTFASIFSACLSKNIGAQVHSLTIKMGLDNSTLVGNSTVAMYSGCGDLISAHLAFERISEKDIISWNSMISGCSKEDCHEAAVAIYYGMQKAGIEPDEFTFGSLLVCSQVTKHADIILAIVRKNGLITSTQLCNALISAYSKYGNIQNGFRIFSEMNSRNLISWNSILSGCVLNGHPLKGLELFSDLVKSEVRPNAYTLSIMLSTCASISALRRGKQVHAYILKSRSASETSVGNSLITMYSKCGVRSWCSRVFDRMSERDLVSWNAMLAAYAEHGDGREVIDCFKMMQGSGAEADQVTFTIVLSACSHAGLVEEGRHIFSSMVKDYRIEPGADQYTCMIDLLGRAGHLDEAERLINGMMPHKIDAKTWWALLSACSTYGNTRLGKIAADFLLEIEPGNPAVYVLFCNINASAGLWEEASAMRGQMRKKGVLKKPGYSWIEAQNRSSVQTT